MSGSVSAVLGDRQLIHAILPPYEPPPPWIPPQNRRTHPDYHNDLVKFLPRNMTLVRPRAMGSLGFNIRGGVDMGSGVYVSQVLQNTDADNAGLKEGDQILSCNGNSFENIMHSEAVRILKSASEINLVVRYFPYGYQKSYEKSKLAGEYGGSSGPASPRHAPASPPPVLHHAEPHQQPLRSQGYAPTMHGNPGKPGVTYGRDGYGPSSVEYSQDSMGPHSMDYGRDLQGPPSMEHSVEYNRGPPGVEYNRGPSGVEYNRGQLGGEYNRGPPSVEYDRVPPNRDYNRSPPTVEYSRDNYGPPSVDYSQDNYGQPSVEYSQQGFGPPSVEYSRSDYGPPSGDYQQHDSPNVEYNREGQGPPSVEYSRDSFMHETDSVASRGLQGSDQYHQTSYDRDSNTRDSYSTGNRYEGR